MQKNAMTTSNNFNRTGFLQKHSGWGLLLAMCLMVCLPAGCAKKDVPTEDEGMVLRRCMLSKLRTLDPCDMRDVYSMSVGAEMYESLYRYHALKRPYEITPLLADGLPEISDDNLTYTIRIKKGVRFQDDPCFPDGKGRELTARDFVYAIKRIANVKTKSRNWASFKDKIIGLDNFRDYTKTFKGTKEWDVDYSREIEGFKALDNHTLQIKLIKPWPQIIDAALTDTMTSPIPHEAIDYYKEDIIQHPVGTGPFRLKAWRRGCYVELVRNENWRGELYPSEGSPGDREAGLLEDAGKPIPFADRVVWRVIQETQPAWLLFMRGEFDSMGIFKDNFDGTINVQTHELNDEMIGRGVALKKFNDPSVFWIGFNMKDPVLGKNKPLRKAICRAYNRERYIDLFNNGRGHVAHGFVAPGLDSYDADIHKYDYSKYDPQEARELLKEAEEVHGGPIPPLTLSMPGTDTFNRQSGQYAQRLFSKVGLELNVEYMDWPTYLDKMVNGDLQLFFSGVSAGYPDAIDFLKMFVTKYHAPNGGNAFFYSNSEIDALHDKAEVMLPSEERLELYRKMERMILDDYPAVFISHRVSYALAHGWYENYKPHVYSYGLNKYRKVDEVQRSGYKERLKELKEKK